MGIPVEADNLDNIDEKYHELYEEDDGKYRLTGVDGMKTQGDIDRLQTSIRKERSDHKETKNKLKAYGDISSDGLQEKLERLDELNQIIDEDNKINDQEVEKLVDKRVQNRVAKVERERDALQTKVTEHEATIFDFKTKDKNRTIRDSISAAIAKSEGFLPAAREDALIIGSSLFELNDENEVIAKENSGIDVGTTPMEWLEGAKEKRPFWWGDSQGGGSRTGGNLLTGNNPWTAEHWNITEQAKVMSQDRAKAEKLAKAANSKIGAISPTKAA